MISPLTGEVCCSPCALELYQTNSWTPGFCRRQWNNRSRRFPERRVWASLLISKNTKCAPALHSSSVYIDIHWISGFYGLTQCTLSRLRAPCYDSLRLCGSPKFSSSSRTRPPPPSSAELPSPLLISPERPGASTNSREHNYLKINVKNTKTWSWQNCSQTVALNAEKKNVRSGYWSDVSRHLLCGNKQKKTLLQQISHFKASHLNGMS